MMNGPTVRNDAVPHNTLEGSKKAALAGGVGTLVEYFDFAVYGFVAVYISPQFFPNTDPAVSMLATLLVFGSAYLMRPFGALYFGWLGDRVGRRRALLITVVGMGSLSGVIGVLPGYTQIGVAASVLLAVIRLGQGFCAGGEVAGASTYISESSTQGRRGFFTSAMAVGSVGGFALAAVTCGAVSSVVSAEDMAAWGWRIPFLLTIPLTTLCMYYRLKLEDTPEFKTMPKSEIVRVPLKEVVTKNFGSLVRIVLLCIAATGSGNLAVTYFGTYFLSVRHLAAAPTYWMTAIVIALIVLTYPLIGSLSDRYGRKKIMTMGLIGYLVLGYPTFWAMENAESFWLIGLAFLVFMMPNALVLVPGYVLNTEIMPRNVRYTGTALGIALGFVITGLLPAFASTVIAATGTITVLAIWLAFLSVIGYLALRKLPDTAGRPLITTSIKTLT